MPYPTLASLPDWVKEMPKHAQEIYQAAWNSAYEQYKDEGKAAATAIMAVKKQYKKVGDKWLAKESTSKKSQEATMTTVIDEEISALESFRIKYHELIQEVGKRNALLDSKRIKQIMLLCQDLLSSEEPDEEEAKEVASQIDNELIWVREQAVMKTEDGQHFPAAAYAYVPDSDKPSTWKLRIWEDPDKKVTRKQLGAAAAALSPGGFRGQKVQIPSADLPAVKRKIRSAYRSLDVPDEEIPRWVRESEHRELVLEYMPLTEATIDKGRARVIVIKAGFNTSMDRYYPPEVLARDCGIFEGAKMYADHPSESEERDRPERSIRDWVATLRNVQCDENGTVTGEAEVIEPWLQARLAALRDKDMLSEMGISIDAVGSASKAEIEGTKTLVVERLVRARSVDFVTEPGAGGVVTFYEADRDRDIDLIELMALKERRPDLVKAIESEAEGRIKEEVKRIMENEERIAELEGQIKTLTEERDGLLTKAQEAETARLIAETRANVEKALIEADLPEAAKKRLVDQYADKTSDEGLADAIKAEADYVAAVRESGKVTGMGGRQETAEDAEKALTEAAKRLNPEWTDEQIATFVRGR